jgi:hypothetical protein
MTDRNLTVARLVEDEIEGVEIEGDAFGDCSIHSVSHRRSKSEQS